MAKKSKVIKPPIKPKDTPVAAAPAVQARPPLATAKDFYPSIEKRIEDLPTISDKLTSDRVQATFAGMLMMNTADLLKLNRSPNISILESQVARLLARTLRELPDDKRELKFDDNGKPVFDNDGNQVKQTVRLNKDALQNEKQALDTIKYVHERSFGKPKVTIEHLGIPQQPTNIITPEMVLAAMDNLPKDVIDVLATSTHSAAVKKEKNG